MFPSFSKAKACLYQLCCKAGLKTKIAMEEEKKNLYKFGRYTTDKKRYIFNRCVITIHFSYWNSPKASARRRWMLSKSQMPHLCCTWLCKQLLLLHLWIFTAHPHKPSWVFVLCVTARALHLGPVLFFVPEISISTLHFLNLQSFTASGHPALLIR